MAFEPNEPTRHACESPTSCERLFRSVAAVETVVGVEEPPRNLVPVVCEGGAAPFDHACRTCYLIIETGVQGSREGRAIRLGKPGVLSATIVHHASLQGRHERKFRAHRLKGRDAERLSRIGMNEGICIGKQFGQCLPARKVPQQNDSAAEVLCLFLKPLLQGTTSGNEQTVILRLTRRVRIEEDEHHIHQQPNLLLQGESARVQQKPGTVTTAHPVQQVTARLGTSDAAVRSNRRLRPWEAR